MKDFITAAERLDLDDERKNCACCHTYVMGACPIKYKGLIFCDTNCFDDVTGLITEEFKNHV